MNSNTELGNCHVSCAQRAGCDLFRKALNARLRNLCLIVGTGNLLVFLNGSISWLKQCFKDEFVRDSQDLASQRLAEARQHELHLGSLLETRNFSPSPLPGSLNVNPQSSESPRGICLPITLREAQCRVDGRGTLTGDQLEDEAKAT